MKFLILIFLSLNLYAEDELCSEFQGNLSAVDEVSKILTALKYYKVCEKFSIDKYEVCGFTYSDGNSYGEKLLNCKIFFESPYITGKVLQRKFYTNCSSCLKGALNLLEGKKRLDLEVPTTVVSKLMCDLSQINFNLEEYKGFKFRVDTLKGSHCYDITRYYSFPSKKEDKSLFIKTDACK